jgi:hypothetical protein
LDERERRYRRREVHGSCRPKKKEMGRCQDLRKERGGV